MTSSCARILLLLALQLPLTGAAFAQTSPQPDSLFQAYVAESWQNHPDLRSMQAMVEAESSRTTMSRAWMNPELRGGLMNVPETFKLDEDPMTMLQIGLMQRIPFPGKRGAAAQAGRARTRAAAADLDNARYEMATMVAMAYYDLAAALENRRILERGRALTEEMMQAAGAMFSAGMGAQADVLRARLEIEQWNQRLAENEAEIARRRAALAYAVGRVDPASLADPVLPETLPALPDLQAALSGESLARTPELRSAELRADAADAELRRARLDYWPDFDVMAAVGLRQDLQTVGEDPHTGAPVPEVMDQDNMYSFEVTIPLPLFYRGNQRAMIREARAMRRASEADAVNAALAKQQELRELHASLTERLNRYRIVAGGVLEQAEDTWRATVVDYRGARVPFMNLAEARMAVVMAEMDAIMLRAEAWATYRNWQAALGEDALANER